MKLDKIRKACIGDYEVILYTGFSIYLSISQVIKIGEALILCTCLIIDGNVLFNR